MTRHRMVQTIAFLLFLSVGIFAQIYSTLQGGPWSAPSTWQSGVVPGAGDKVIIIGPVQLDVGGDYYVNALTVEPAGKLQTVVTAPPSHMYVTQDVWNKGLIEGKGSLTPLQFTIGGALINAGQWKTFEVFFSDTLQHLLRAEPGSYFNPKAVMAVDATIISDRDMYLYGLDFKAQKLILNLDYATFDSTTVYFLEGSHLMVDLIVGQGNAIAGDATSSIPYGVNTFQPAFWDVHIKGETQVETKIFFMSSVTIEDTLHVTNGYISSFNMVVEGDLVNNGYVLPNDQNTTLYFECAGNIVNNGYFEAAEITLTGGGPHYLTTDLGSVFSPDLLNYDTDDIVISNSPLRFDGTTISLKKLVLQPGHDLNLLLNCTVFVDTLEGNNNTLKTTDAVSLSSNYTDNTYRNLSLEGTVLIDGFITFDGQTINNGTMRLPSGASSVRKVILQGSFTNNGVIERNDINAALPFDVAADITNQGDWESKNLNFSSLDRGPYTFTTDTTQTFNPGTVSGPNTTVISGSSLRFDASPVTLGHVILQPGHNLILNQNSSLQVDTLTANGNRIHSDGAYTLLRLSAQGPLFDSVVLDDTCMFDTFVNFMGNAANYGVMQVVNGSTIAHLLHFKGNFHNFGDIAQNDKNTGLRFEIEGDLENAGFWNSQPVELKGTTPQNVSIPDSANFQAELHIFAMRSGFLYQWEKDGIPLSNGGHISGASTSTLILSSVSPADYGTYRCRIDSSGQIIYSREVVINNVITGIETEGDGEPPLSQLPSHFRLGQNYPNPFNPTTIIPYALPTASQVRLTLHDVLGREIRVLYQGRQPAGVHRATLDGADLAAGVYFYRLQADGFVQVRKLLLVK